MRGFVGSKVKYSNGADNKSSSTGGSTILHQPVSTAPPETTNLILSLPGAFHIILCFPSLVTHPVCDFWSEFDGEHLNTLKNVRAAFISHNEDDYRGCLGLNERFSAMPVAQAYTYLSERDEKWAIVVMCVLRLGVLRPVMGLWMTAEPLIVSTALPRPPMSLIWAAHIQQHCLLAVKDFTWRTNDSVDMQGWQRRYRGGTKIISSFFGLKRGKEREIQVASLKTLVVLQNSSKSSIKESFCATRK